MRPGASKTAIISTLYHLLKSNTKTYCWPSLATIQKNLAKYYGVEISIRTIKLHLQELRDFGYIKSFRRRGKNSDGTFFNLTSNRSLTLRSLVFLKSIGVKVAKYLWNWARSGILPRKSSTFDPEKPLHDLSDRSGQNPLYFPNIFNSLVPPNPSSST